MAQTTRRSWTRPGASRAAIPGVETLGPHLLCVKHAQHRHCCSGLSVDDDVVRPSHQCALHPARAAAFRKRGKLCYLALDILHQEGGTTLMSRRKIFRVFILIEANQQPKIPHIIDTGGNP